MSLLPPENMILFLLLYGKHDFLFDDRKKKKKRSHCSITSCAKIIFYCLFRNHIVICAVCTDNEWDKNVLIGWQDVLVKLTHFIFVCLRTGVGATHTMTIWEFKRAVFWTLEMISARNENSKRDSSLRY